MPGVLGRCRADARLHVRLSAPPPIITNPNPTRIATLLGPVRGNVGPTSTPPPVLPLPLEDPLPFEEEPPPFAVPPPFPDDDPPPPAEPPLVALPVDVGDEDGAFEPVVADCDVDGCEPVALVPEWLLLVARCATVTRASVIVMRSPKRMISTRARLACTPQLHHKCDLVPRSSAARRGA